MHIHLAIVTRPVVDVIKLATRVPDQREAIGINEPTALAAAHGLPNGSGQKWHVILPHDELAAAGLACALRAQGARPPMLDVRVEGEHVPVPG